MTIYARLEDGWIRVPFSGRELAKVEIGVGESEPNVWKPAFMHTVNGERFAQVRPMGTYLNPPQVWLRVDGYSTLIGYLGAQPVETTGRRHSRR